VGEWVGGCLSALVCCTLAVANIICCVLMCWLVGVCAFFYLFVCGRTRSVCQRTCDNSHMPMGLSLLCADVLACRGGLFLLPLCLRAHSSCLSTYVAYNFHMSMGLSRMALSMLICANGLQSKLQNRPHCKDVNLAMFLVLFSVSRAFIGWCFCCGCIVCG
jgi:hypothetical protein